MDAETSPAEDTMATLEDIKNSNENDITGKSRFLSLPPEIRLEIYEQTLFQNRFLWKGGVHKVTMSWWCGSWQLGALLRVCRLMTKEILPFIYTYLTFKFEIRAFPFAEHPIDFFKCRFWSHLRNVDFDLSLGLGRGKHAKIATDVTQFLNTIVEIRELLTVSVSVQVWDCVTKAEVVEVLTLLGRMRARKAGTVSMTTRRDSLRAPAVTLHEWVEMLLESGA